MLNIDLLIFDLDGTLVDTRRDLTNSINYARKEFGLPTLELDEVMRYVGDGARHLLKRSFPDADDGHIGQAMSHFQNHYREHLLDFSTLYSGVMEVLHHFKNKKMAVISNKPEEFTRSIVSGLKIADYFQIVLGGDSVNSMKPSPEPLLQVMDRLSAKPEKTMMIGDSATDIQAGCQAKACTCAVTYGFRAREILAEQFPDFIIDQINELAEIVV